MEPVRGTSSPPGGALLSSEGARFVAAAGFAGCVELSNGTAAAILEPNLGGRVLSFTLGGSEVLHQEPDQNGVIWDGKENVRHPAGGRFDIGPEYGGIPHASLWLGTWRAEIVGPRTARLTSAVLPETGLQLIREFTLAPSEPHLRCTQVIHNRGDNPLRTFHWGRTFVRSGGIAFAPLAAERFPRGYALGDPVIDFHPAPEPNVRIREGILELLCPPAKAKFNFDVEPGWLAYLDRSGLLFIKVFPVYPDRPYGELAANNASFWYATRENTPTWPLREPVVEVEPIGPLELISPGAAAVFTEDWWVERGAFPETGCDVDLTWVRGAVGRAQARATIVMASSANSVAARPSGRADPHSPCE